MLYIFLALVASSMVGAAPNGSIPFNPWTVSTTSGLFTGSISNSSRDVARFLHVPYAEAPIGPLRFSAPVWKRPNLAVTDATTFGVSCPQYITGLNTSFFKEISPDFDIFGETGEDCLSVSIWAPAWAVAKANHMGKWNPGQATGGGLPVVVYLPGGAFIQGGVNVAYQIPENWVQRSQKHIVITMNYRLNIFGFPNARALNGTLPNLGLLDQRIAMEWVQRNAASFGGDPSRITLWGQSAGAASADVYNFAYPQDPIATAFIYDSGTAFLADSTSSSDVTHSNFSYVASHLGCQSSDPATELACMRQVPSQEIEDFLRSYYDNGTTPKLSFLPIEDNITLFTNYTERALAGLLSDKPAILGTNTHEAAALLPYNPSGPSETEVKAVTDEDFFCPAIDMTSYRLAVGRTTYRYLYHGNFSNISPLPWEGAYHCSELPLIFGTSAITRGNSTPFEYALSAYMQDMYLSFITNHTSLPSLGWPAWTSNGSALALSPEPGTVSSFISAAVLTAPCA